MKPVAVCQDNLESDYVIAGNTVFQTTRAAGIGRNVTSNGAMLETGGIRRIKQFLLADCSFQIGRDHTRLHEGNGVGKIDLLNPVHPYQGKRNAAPHWNTASHVTIARSPRR